MALICRVAMLAECSQRGIGQRTYVDLRGTHQSINVASLIRSSRRYSYRLPSEARALLRGIRCRSKCFVLSAPLDKIPLDKIPLDKIQPARMSATLWSVTTVPAVYGRLPSSYASRLMCTRRVLR